MKIEHIAFNVADPVCVAAWYGQHLGLKVVRHFPQPVQMHFLADDTGSTVLELYCNPPDKVPDYASMDPLLLHIAFVSQNPETDSERLVAAGATFISKTTTGDGSLLFMLRDPWGLSIQLCKRVKPLV